MTTSTTPLMPSRSARGTNGRLVEVDGVPSVWDAKGNLLDDGVRTYTYDHANRLSSVVQGSDTYTFAYNGLGDRLQQAVNTVPTDYTINSDIQVCRAKYPWRWDRFLVPARMGS